MRNTTGNTSRKINLIMRLFVLVLAFTSITLLNGKHIEAAKDTKSPSMSLKQNITSPTNTSVKVVISVADTSGISNVKWAYGKQKTSYFTKSGKSLKLSSKNQATITISKNGDYTFFVKDKAGNTRIRILTVTNIDKVIPTVTYSLSTSEPTNQAVKIKVNSNDEGSGVRNALYLYGKKTLDDFKQATSAKAIKLNAYDNGYVTATKNGYVTVLITDIAGNQTLIVIKIKNIDTVSPDLQLNYSVMNQAATITVQAEDAGSGIKNINYLKGKITDVTNAKWESSGIDITGKTNFTGKSSGNYSVLVEDKAGNKTIEVIPVELEFRAVWISYLEFLKYAKGGVTKETFEKDIDTMFDNVTAMNMNAVVVQVRPFGDAMYQSSYFPWSKYISGEQGVDPGFDPLEYMVEAAHARDLEFHAWLNPYRVTTASTDYSDLSEDNPARVWHEDDIETNDRNVLSYSGNLYYNPASKEVQNLITKGIKEIVTKYDVDGIHFDDYFYPSLGANYQNNFDSVEYKAYAEQCAVDNIKPLTIADWRRENVNKLVRGVYKTIKSIESSVEFGISPGGFYNTLLSDTAYYTDIETWLSSNNYVDYICPQIYWTFSHSSYPYDKTLDKWLSYRTSSTVKVYVGIATYKAGSSLEDDWENDDEVLKDQVEYGRNTGKVDGFIFFRYNFFYNDVTEPGVKKLLEIL